MPTPILLRTSTTEKALKSLIATLIASNTTVAFAQPALIATTLATTINAYQLTPFAMATFPMELAAAAIQGTSSQGQPASSREKLKTPSASPSTQEAFAPDAIPAISIIKPQLGASP